MSCARFASGQVFAVVIALGWLVGCGDDGTSESGSPDVSDSDSDDSGQADAAGSDTSADAGDDVYAIMIEAPENAEAGTTLSDVRVTVISSSG